MWHIPPGSPCICTLPELPSSHTRRQPAGYQTRPKYAEPPSLRVRWRCNRPCNPTWRFRRHPRDRAMLRKKPPVRSSTHKTRRPFPLGGGRSQRLHSVLSLTIKSRSWGSHMEPRLQSRWKTAGQEFYGRYLHKHGKPMLEPSASRNEFNMYTCLLAKIWYLAQILQPTKDHMQQLTTVCTWFIWQGTIFRVPLFNLQLSRVDHERKIRSRRQRKDIGKYSFVNRTIQHWNQLPAEVLGILPRKQITFKKRVRKVIIELN